jgi:hypothetical protein
MFGTQPLSVTLQSRSRFSTSRRVVLCGCATPALRLAAMEAIHNQTQPPTPRVLSIQSHVVHGYVGNKCAVFPLQVG